MNQQPQDAGDIGARRAAGRAATAPPIG